jgi:hypothetical protein
MLSIKIYLSSFQKLPFNHYRQQRDAALTIKTKRNNRQYTNVPSPKLSPGLHHLPSGIPWGCLDSYIPQDILNTSPRYPQRIARVSFCREGIRTIGATKETLPVGTSDLIYWLRSKKPKRAFPSTLTFYDRKFSTDFDFSFLNCILAFLKPIPYEPA